VFLPLVVTELVSTVKSPRTTTVTPMNEAGVLRGSMLLSVASEVTRASEYFSTSRVVAGMQVGIDVGASRYHRSGNGVRYYRSRKHASSIGRQCWDGEHAGSSSSGKRQLIEACHSYLRIDGC